MFQLHPETLQYFSDFSDLDSPEKQKNSETFKTHAEKVSGVNLAFYSIKTNQSSKETRN